MIAGGCMGAGACGWDWGGAQVGVWGWIGKAVACGGACPAGGWDWDGAGGWTGG